MSDLARFRIAFEALTGHAPFPWQVNLFNKWFAKGKVPPSCSLPTGLGKTNVIAIWLIAVADNPAQVPRRLVYIVNRRTVVDQATEETRKIRERLIATGRPGVLAELANRLAAIAADPTAGPLAISTLRGQFADNGEWRADPGRPAVVVGTVDMIGSRLLFSGYGVGYRSRPLHAGFLGQDSLIVHDEAHLEPAFQDLLMTIQREQQRGRRPDFRPLRVMALSATSRDSENATDVALTLSPEDLAHSIAKKRIEAKKVLAPQPIDDEKKTADAVADLALKHKDSGQAILVFVRKVEDVERVVDRLKKAKIADAQIERLTGTLRGKERDELVTKPVFQRFLPPAAEGMDTNLAEVTVYLVCTSAGEVGVNISADHLVCDLTPFDSMAQRLGRVNRFGEGDAKIDVVYPEKFDQKGPLSPAREKTLALLKELPSLPERNDEPGVSRYDASPKALGDLRERTDLPWKIEEAFTPTPTILTATDILFDAWALTTIREKLPGRPPVEPYLHGISGWEPPETHVVWRADVQHLADALASGSLDADDLEDLLDDYDIKPWESLRDTTTRKRPAKGVKEKLQDLALKKLGEAEAGLPVGDLPAILIDPAGRPTPMTIRDAAESDLAGCTVLLPIEVGGLSENGTFDPTSSQASDVADEIPRESWNDARDQRKRDSQVAKESDSKKPSLPRLRVLLCSTEDGWRAEYVAAPQAPTLPILPGETLDDRQTLRRKVLDKTRMSCKHEVPIGDDADSGPTRILLYLTDPKIPGAPGETRQTLEEHTRAIVDAAERIGNAIGLDEPMRQALVFAARCHDFGKDRDRWQRYARNSDLSKPLAKSPAYLHWRFLADYRHEFGSLLDVQAEPEFQKLNDELKDLVLHLIAAHHGRARPHFPSDEAFDPEPNGKKVGAIASEVPRRFARLQRKYGRWGLAYLESLLRAADYTASAKPSATVEDES